MIKVNLEIILNKSWDGYGDNNVNEDCLLEDLLTTLQDPVVSQEEILSVTIKSKQRL